ncbi:MAG: hypothetical protein RIS58_869 [Actinomycetota bacterium]
MEQPHDTVDIAQNCVGWHTVSVPRFEPFRATRYADSQRLATLSAPPYDVISDAQRARYAAQSHHNIVHVDMPLSSGGGDPYLEAARTLESWKSTGVLVADAEQSFSLYRLSFVDATGAQRNTVGVIGALEVVDEGAGGVLPHERTTPKAKTDRLELTRATEMNLSPVWGLSLAKDLSKSLADQGEVLGTFTDENSVTHSIERVTDPERVAHIASVVGSEPVVIADGHHRYAISRTYRDEIRAARGSASTGAELTMTYVNELVEEQLSVAAIHRYYSDTTADALLDALSKRFDLSDAPASDDKTLARMNSFGCLYYSDANGRSYWLTPKSGSFPGVRDLDSARLEFALTDTTHTVSYQHGQHEAIDKLTSPGCVAAILIRPVSVAEIQRTANERLLMPPKSTFFTPKLQTGLVMREIFAN